MQSKTHRNFFEPFQNASFSICHVAGVFIRNVKSFKGALKSELVRLALVSSLTFMTLESSFICYPIS